MQSHFNPSHEEEDLQSNGTLADLLLTMVAVILLILIMLVPHIDFSSTSSTSPPQTNTQREAKIAQKLADLRLTKQGTPLTIIVIAQDGLHLGDAQKSLISTDQIPEDKTLEAFLSKIREARTPLLLLVLPNGLENAFQLEPLLATHQPLTIQHVRMDKECRFAKEVALLRACQQLL